MAQTRRQEIITHLEAGPATVRDLAELMGIPVRDVIAHLDHVRRSKESTLRVDPAVCQQCDFVFENRRRLTKPSRCPQCKNERISWPLLSLG
ncbi:MAG: transcriptional regulator [bacterium]